MDVAKLTGWQLRHAIECAVKTGNRAALDEVLRSGYRPTQRELHMLADYHADRQKRPAHRPRSDDPSKLAQNRPLLWMACDFVERYKRAQRARGRVKGVQAEAIDKSLAFVARRYGGEPRAANEQAIEAALDRIAAKIGYRLTTNRIADRLARGGTRPKSRT